MNKVHRTITAPDKHEREHNEPAGGAITNIAVQNLKPGPKRRLVMFQNGLGVRVAALPHSTRTFVFRYKFEGAQRILALGSYPEMTVAAAIAAHAKERAAVKAQGEARVDPMAQRRKAKAEAKAAQQATEQRLTMRDAFDEWQKRYLKLEHRDKGKAMGEEFARHVFPAFGDKALEDVRKRDVMELFDALRADGKVRTAKGVLSHLKQFFDFCTDRDILDHHPIPTLKAGKLVGKLKPKDRALADWEVSRLLHRLPLVDLHPVTTLALRFLLATGQRPGDVSGMAKLEIDKGGTVWTIPESRYKEDVDQVVPLSDFARSILAEAETYNSGSRFVFPAVTFLRQTDVAKPDAPIERHSLSRAVLRKLGTATDAETEPAAGELGIAKFGPHDLRRTCRTGLAALGVLDEIAERVLGHAVGGEMNAVYNRHRYLNEKRDALDRWGAHLAELSRHGVARGAV